MKKTMIVIMILLSVSSLVYCKPSRRSLIEVHILNSRRLARRADVGLGIVEWFGDKQWYPPTVTNMLDKIEYVADAGWMIYTNDIGEEWSYRAETDSETGYRTTKDFIKLMKDLAGNPQNFFILRDKVKQ